MAAILDKTRHRGAERAVVDKKAKRGERGAGGREETPTGELSLVSHPLTMTLNGNMSCTHCGPMKIK